MSLKIGIIGCRGIPNNYGGFEQFAEYLSVGLAGNGHDVTVYNSHKHPFREHIWQGVHIIKRYDPEYLIGTAGQFMYDFNCIIHARTQKFDLILILGYTSSAVWYPFFPKDCLVFMNMDGLEWKRTKYSRLVQQFLLYAEKLAVKHADQCIADSIAIKEYLDTKYGINAHFISYGAEIHAAPDVSLISSFGVMSQEYLLLIARMEPENNIESILEGFRISGTPRILLVIGNTQNKFGSKMVAKYASVVNIHFVGSVYEMATLNALRYHCFLYFHGHSVGGTNPSLLEAMASEALICAHHNQFNQSILGTDAFYFKDHVQVSKVIHDANDSKERMSWILNNKEKIKKNHSWETIISSYENKFVETLTKTAS